jgi:hypothetical protein
MAENIRRRKLGSYVKYHFYSIITVLNFGQRFTHCRSCRIADMTPPERSEWTVMEASKRQFGAGIYPPGMRVLCSENRASYLLVFIPTAAFVFDPHLEQHPLCTQIVPSQFGHDHLIVSYFIKSLMPLSLILPRFSIMLIPYFVLYLLSKCFTAAQG